MKIHSTQLSPLQLKEKALKPRNRLCYYYYRSLINRTRYYKYNNAQAVVGAGGTGKTVYAVISSYILNPRKFTEDKYVNTAKEFLKAIDESKPSDSIVWDELGASMSARKWHSMSNILTGEVLQTYRANKLSVFFCTPDLSFVDVQARKMMTSYCEVKRGGNIKSTVFLYKININRRDGQIWFPHYRGIVNSKYMRMPKIDIPKKLINKVPKEIWKGIAEKEARFKGKIRKGSLKSISIMEKQEGEVTDTIFDLINKVQKDKVKYMNEKGKLDVYLMQTLLGVGRHKSTQIKKFIEAKTARETPPPSK